MGIRDMFNHKYPITNLHEIDLTFMHDDIDKMIALLESWESIIEELREGLNDLNGINSRVIALENLTTGLNQAYSDIAALKNQTRVNTSAIDAIRLELDNLVDSWDEFINSFTYYVDSKVEIEKRARIKGDYDLDVKIESLKIQVYDDIEILYQLIQQLNPVDVYNPVRGLREDFDKNNADVYQDLRYFGFTNAELSEFGVSNNHVASLVHNNRDYALNAKIRFKRHWLFSPWTGKRCPHYNAISEMYVVGIGGANNNAFYAAIAAESKTNDDLADYIVDNKSRYLYMV